MPRVCTICTHPDRPAIDMMLVNGKPLRDIAGRFGTSKSALERHQVQHLPASLAEARRAEEAARADDLLGQLLGLQADARRIGKKAEDTGDLKTALAGVRELVRIVELTAKLVGELNERPEVNVLVAPQWLAVRTALLEALRPYPEARLAVASRLATLEASA